MTFDPPAGISEPDDILVVAAGGSGGRFAALSLSWASGHRYLAVTRPVEDCVTLGNPINGGSD